MERLEVRRRPSTLRISGRPSTTTPSLLYGYRCVSSRALSGKDGKKSWEGERRGGEKELLCIKLWCQINRAKRKRLVSEIRNFHVLKYKR